MTCHYCCCFFLDHQNTKQCNFSSRWKFFSAFFFFLSTWISEGSLLGSSPRYTIYMTSEANTIIQFLASVLSGYITKLKEKVSGVILSWSVIPGLTSIGWRGSEIQRSYPSISKCFVSPKLRTKWVKWCTYSSQKISKLGLWKELCREFWMVRLLVCGNTLFVLFDSIDLVFQHAFWIMLFGVKVTTSATY